MAESSAAAFGRVGTYRSVNGHGRDGMRFYDVCPVPKDLPARKRLHKMRAVGLTFNNTVHGGRECIEYRYDILSTFPSARRSAEAVRNHWVIESRLDWQLHVMFQEDESPVLPRDFEKLRFSPWQTTPFRH